MTITPAAHRKARLPLPIEVIFSCQVCNNPISEIYEEPDTDKGFRDSNGSSTEHPVTKLWLTECSHLTCGKHLEGGGKCAAFEQPRSAILT